MARIHRVDELSEPPAIGAPYLVPTVYGQWYGKHKWWPVIGPKHEDADIGFPWLHFHIDPRFLPKRSDWWLLQSVYAAPIHESPTTNPELPVPVYRRRECRWKFPEYPDHDARRGFLNRLEAHYAADRLRKTDRGWVCPHRGLLLTNCPTGEDGTIRCPLHGLRWHVDTGLPAFGDAVERKVS